MLRTKGLMNQGVSVSIEKEYVCPRCKKVRCLQMGESDVMGKFPKWIFCSYPGCAGWAVPREEK